MAPTYILTLSCSQRPGIVHAVSSFLFAHGCDIVEHQQFDDTTRDALFLRTEFLSAHDPDAADLSAAFGREVAGKFGMSYTLDRDRPQRALVMVSRMGHCLNDLIFRWRAGSLRTQLVAVVSNHEDLRPMAEAANLPFIHVPVTIDTKPEAEQRLIEMAQQYDVDFVVLARSCRCCPTASAASCTAGPSTSTTHSCPGSRAPSPIARPTTAASLVGATAHYVTSDLDEGPIIEQEVIRIDHAFDPRALATVGQDAEALALSRAVRWHSERRVLLYGRSTVIFR